MPKVDVPQGYGMNELIDAVQRQAGISQDEAKRAVAAMLAFLSVRLPSPLVGRIQTLLDNAAEYPQRERGS